MENYQACDKYSGDRGGCNKTVTRILLTRTVFDRSLHIASIYGGIIKCERRNSWMILDVFICYLIMQADV